MMTMLSFELSLGGSKTPVEPRRARNRDGEAVRSEGFTERRANSAESDGHF